MKSIVAYVRGLLGWVDEDPAIRTSFKRDRCSDELSSDDDAPSLKRVKQLSRTSFPDMATNDLWDNKKESKNVRYVPIQVEAGHPSTSTPNELTIKQGGRFRTVPIRLAGTENGVSTPARKPRMHTPVQPVIHAVDDDEEPEVSWVEARPKISKKPPRLYVNLDDEENEADTDGDEVIFIKKVTTPPPVKPYKFFVSKGPQDNESMYYKVLNQPNDRNSVKQYTKFKVPPGIIKKTKKPTATLPKWLQQQGSSNPTSPRRNYLKLNGNAKSAISEVFNLDEKRNYKELIRQMSTTMRPVAISKSIETINLAEDSASFRMTQRSQKQAMQDLKFVERSRHSEKENEISTEYDPITVASINSSDSEIEIVPSESSSSSVRIEPINTLRDSYKDSAVTSGDFLSKLDSKYKKKRQDTQEKLKDARRESDIISKVNHEQKLALLEHKIKYELSIPESLIEEPQPTVELPILTAEQEKLVNRLLGPGPQGQLLVEKFNLRIHRRDIQTLAGLNWLNDEVINFYMNLLMQRSEERPDLPKVYAANTFFYPKLMQSGQAGLRRWTKKLDIFAHDLMIVPVHLGVHWCLCMVDFRARRVVYLDSMGGRNQPCLDAVQKYLREEHKDKKREPFDDAGWKAESISKDIPQQMNGSDCGMFACTFAEFSSRDAPYSFTQSHMPYLRRKMALEIVQGKLLL